LLKRDTPPGAVSPMANPRIRAELREGLKIGRWRSAAQVAAWLKEAHGIERARKSIYYWFKKYRLRPLLTKGRARNQSCN
ncbi:MAG: hypothetical protein MN733_08990, partial [Nitrososphaera sp.]|nr:hypothetical protein [Nitrososphaera sp.]